MVTKLEDAKITVTLDVAAAKRKAEEFGKERERQEEGRERRKERKKERTTRQEEKRTSVAVIPGAVGARRLWQFVKGLVAIRIAEELAGLGAGHFREAGRGKIVEPLTDVAADVLNKLSTKIVEARTLLSAYLMLAGQVTDVARAQKLVAGEIDPAALLDFAKRAKQVTALQAAVAARRAVIGKEALGMTGADFLERAKNEAFKGMSAGAQN
jgi:hypothetical protein